MNPSSAPRCRPWRRPGLLTGPLAAGVVLTVFWVFLLASLRDKSLTADEPVHATAGYTYWKFNDYRMNPENGNLPQRVAALPLVLSHDRFPPLDAKAWQASEQWRLCDAWFHDEGNDVAGMLRRGRAACGLLAVALGALVWAWSRRLFGPRGGMLSLLLYGLSPTILANGALMTSDTACALFFLASAGSFWAMLHRLSPGRVLVSALLMGGLFVSKMSALLIVPVVLTLVGARLVDGRPLPLGSGGARALVRRSRQALAFAAAAVAHAVVVVLVIWGFYGFRYTGFAHDRTDSDRYAAPWEYVLGQPNPAALLDALQLSPGQQAGVKKIQEAQHTPPFDQWTYPVVDAMPAIRQTVLSPAQVRKYDELMAAPPPALAPRLLQGLRRRQWLPEAYLYGCAHAWCYAQARPAFLNGQFSLQGWKIFYPYTFLVKTPLPVFAVMALALAAAVARWRANGRTPAASCWRRAARGLYATLPLWALLVFYWAAVIPSHLNIGHRHILATYPPLFVLGGAAAGWLDGWRTSRRAARAAGLALGVLLAALAAEVLYRFPNYISYFNGLVRPARAYRHLVDSSLDWGQDLPGLQRYLAARRPAGPVYLSYFGNGSPDYYRIPARPLYSCPRWGLKDLSPLRRPDGLPRQFPDYDLLPDAFGPDHAGVLLKKPAALRLAGGTYCISATMLQPITGEPEGPWNGSSETAYRKLCEIVQPLLDDDPAVRQAALNRHSFAEWHETLIEFEKCRFARLTAFLRHREPDDTVNGSILIYHLSDADLARALDGPPAELAPVADTLARYQELLRINPEYVAAHYSLGVIFLSLGRTAEAIGHFEEGLRINPDDANARFNLGLALDRAGRRQDAIREYEEAVRLKPDYGDAHLNLGIALAQADCMPEAIIHLNAALQLNPDSAETHSNLGTILAQTGQLPEAIQRFEEALQLKPDYAEASYNLGLALDQTGRTEEAIARYEQTLRLKPGFAPVHDSLGVILLQTGRLPEARRHFEQALRINPDDAMARHYLARLRALPPTTNPGD
jgi:tetratricopeptide (TPR) repeat protein